MRYSRLLAFFTVMAAALGGCAHSAVPPLERDLPAGSPTARGSAWQIVASPDKGTSLGNVFYAVADLSSNDTWAVGAWPARSQYLTDTFAAHWNGSKWSTVRTPQAGTPTAQLNSITALASNAVWAAGYAENPSCICGETVVDFWNGSAWKRAATPNPGVADFLAGISAISTDEIWAVGSEWPNQGYSEALILRWNGTSWSADSLSQYPNGGLYSVYAPAHNDAWAFGYYDDGVMLALHWDGTSWTKVAFPDTAEIVSVSGTSPNDVWAAGGYYCGSYCNPQEKLFHWNGSQWSKISIEGFGTAPSWIYSISAVSPDDAWFSGYGEVFPKWQNYISNVTYHWNGKRWADVVNPDQIGCCQLYGVSARTRSDAWAVGQGGSKGTFTMHYVKRRS